MHLSSDFEDLLLELNDASVDYLIVGAFAMGAHGMPRYTGDLDIFYRSTEANVSKLILALNNFGFTGLDCESLLEPETVIQIGYPPSRVDLLNDISGVSFELAWEQRVISELSGIPVAVISLQHLGINKKATGRDKDLVDLRLIEKKMRNAQ